MVPDGSASASVQERESRSKPKKKQSRIHASAFDVAFEAMWFKSEAILL
jgi:hypothetical protein